MGVADDALHTCTNCANAWEEEPTAQSRAVPTTCKVKTCAANEYVDSAHPDKICRACPDGTTSTAGALRTSTVGIAACTDSGTDTAVSACEANYHVVSNVCVRCDIGKTNAAGDDPSGPDTTCDTDPATVTHG